MITSSAASNVPRGGASGSGGGVATSAIGASGSTYSIQTLGKSGSPNLSQSHHRKNLFKKFVQLRKAETEGQNKNDSELSLYQQTLANQHLHKSRFLFDVKDQLINLECVF